MATQIYERYLCSFKDTGETCRRWLYFKNFTSHSSEFEVIRSELEQVFLATLASQLNVTVISDDSGKRIGDRLTLTDMSLEEWASAEQAHMSAANLETEYQAYLDGLNQMRNDPNVIWRLDWTLVSTTP